MESMSAIASHGRPGAKTLAGVIERLDRIETLLADKVTDKPLPLKEAAEYLSLAPSTLYKMTAANRIKFSKPNGKKIFFQRCDLDKYLAQNPVTPTDEIEAEATKRATAGGHHAR